ncbi:glycosyltransferase family 1 protein [Clostridium perfringens]|nr:glycosyltransferase family 1 protein [Clostridium perfringens]MDK0633328.1 glycosyltransferase family 1 protein [Clostridium perfringens]MDK0983793.1 glycosyltransferase family 1 protein [Clostridium perfringens]
MIRVLQVVNDMHRAGLETMLMNYYRNIDRTQIQFDFLTHRPNKSDYDDEIIGLGGKVYYAPRLYPQNYPLYFRYMKHFFKEHPEYTIIHSHIDSMSYIPLLAAKKAGVPVRIAHSHNTSIDRDFKLPLKMLFRKLLPSVATEFCTCGKEAGEFLFPGEKYTFIPNAIDATKFSFSENLRKQKRKDLGILNKFVVGHVGRLSYQKNHKFLIEVFSELIKKEPNSILLLIGVGEKKEEIKKQVNDLGLSNKVIFLGNRSDVNELYQAMDVFVMPSFFEGVPVVGIEAQFANLPCVFSDKIPDEVRFSEKTEFISLNKSTNYWADKILEVSQQQNKRSISDLTLLNSDYNIKNAKSLLENIYLEKVK